MWGLLRNCRREVEEVLVVVERTVEIYSRREIESGGDARILSADVDLSEGVGVGGVRFSYVQQIKVQMYRIQLAWSIVSGPARGWRVMPLALSLTVCVLSSSIVVSSVYFRT